VQQQKEAAESKLQGAWAFRVVIGDVQSNLSLNPPNRADSGEHSANLQA